MSKCQLLFSIIAAATFSLIALPAFAHGGGLDRCGGHHDRKRGGYHVHNRAAYCACYPKECETTPPRSTTPSKAAAEPRAAPLTGEASISKTATVYVTKTGSKYHRDGCSSLRSSRIPRYVVQLENDGNSASMTAASRVR